MRKHEENVLTMYKTVSSILDGAGGTFSDFTGFQGIFDNFKALITGIEQKETELNSLTAGKTLSKRDAEKSLIDLMMKTSAAMVLYASSVKNTELREKVRMTKSELKKIRDTELLLKARELKSLASLNESNLTGYGIAPEDITDLESKINAYETSLTSKEASFADKTAAREELTLLFKSANSALKDELDRFVELIKDSEPDLYNMYKNARYIKNLGVRHNGEEQHAPEEVENQ